MKNKKNIIIVIVIIVAYLALAIVLFGWENFINKFQGINIMLSTGEKWQLKDGIWSNMEDSKEYNWKKFDVYINNQLLGNYDLMYNNKWYIFDGNRKSIKYDGKLLGISGNKKYEVIDFQKQNLDTKGENLLKQILKDDNIDYPKSFELAEKVTLDIDGDGNDETIYTISNAFTYDTDINKEFSIIFIDDDEVQVLYKRYSDVQNHYDLCVPRVSNVIDINKDSKYEIIFECTYYSELGSCSMLYELSDDEYKFKIGC